MSALSADVVIVGGGGVGSAIAYFLTRGESPPSVVVLERDPSYAQASTALAAGGIRQQFSTPENVLMSQFGYAFIEGGAETLAVGDRRPDLGLKAKPYLRLAPASGRDAMREQYEMQQGLGARPQWLEPDALAQRFPWMRTDGVDAALLGGPGEGVFDPYALLQAFRAKAIDQGVRYVGTAAVGFERSPDGRIAAVRLADGGEVACGLAINAAGPRAGRVAAMAGLELPVIPIRAQTFSFRTEQPIPDCPVVVDQVGGVMFRPEGEIFICTGGPGALEDAGEDFSIDYPLFDDVLWPRLAERTAVFEAVKFQRAWTGHMEWCQFDGNAVIGPHPECENFMFANGFSGHGVQHLPAAGRAVSELVLEGRYATLDLSRFGYGRIARGEPLTERV